MVIPVASWLDDDWPDVLPGRNWSALSTEEKHERILHAAGRVFAREGLDASMPAVAAEAGAGIGSLYRQFPSKQDLMAALVVRRLLQTEAAAAQAAAQPGDHWQALKEMLWVTVERHAADDFLGMAWTQVEEHEQVQVAASATTRAFARVIDLARAEGGIRPDATAFDIRMLFAATRASRQVHPDAWQRVLELMIDGLAASPIG
ncbi:MAG TPA: helix-turn-helix domain-containing protein [Solirubrobacteraceae bacterium]|nr:helix-turn-helix domain-containing protein [Solirubrobacteraceae bacterium]